MFFAIQCDAKNKLHWTATKMLWINCVRSSSLPPAFVKGLATYRTDSHVRDVARKSLKKFR